MFKRAISLLVIVGIFSGLFSSPAQAAITSNIACSGGGYFRVVNNVVEPKAAADSTVANKCKGTAVVPEGVTKIEDQGFNGENLMTNISLPNSLTIVGGNGLAGTGLSSVNLPPNLVTLRQGALQYNPYLTSLVIPPNVSVIDTFLVFGASGLCDVYFLGMNAPTTASGAFAQICESPSFWGAGYPTGSGTPKAWVPQGSNGYPSIGSDFGGLSVQNGGSILLFDANGGDSGTVPATQVLAANTSIQIPANTGTLARTNYRFTGWCTTKQDDGTGSCYTPGSTLVAPQGTTILYANWQGKPKVTYDGNGATGGNVPVDSASPYEENSTVTVLTNTGLLTRTGYTFDGWTTASNGTGTFLPAGYTFNIQSSNATLYAKWAPKTNTVTYNSNGGTSVSNGSFVTGGQIASEPTPPTREGYLFAGWSATNGGSIESFPYSPSALGDTTLYAKWTVRQFGVWYTGNGNTSGYGMGPNPHDFGASVTVRANENSLAKTGYLFDGWNTQADGNGIDRAVGSTFTIGAENVDLFAQWAIQSYNFSYNGNGNLGGSLPAATTSREYNSFVYLLHSDLTKPGYVFAGWNTQADGSGTQYGYPSRFPMPANDVTLYAQWANTGTVTYSGNSNTGGTVPVDGGSPCNFGTSVTVLANSGLLAKSGYKFIGWNTSADGSGTSYAANGSATFVMPESDVTLYAVWELEPEVVNPVPTVGSVGNSPVTLPRFTSGSTELTNTCKAAIKKIFKKSGADAVYVITGVAGILPGVPKAHVESLASKRAAKVKAYLVKLGVKASSITISIKITKIKVIPKTSIVSKILTK